MIHDDQVVIQFMQHLDSHIVPQQLMDRVAYGPIIPPEMQWGKLFEHMIP
jgi:hypothetical protein